MTCVSKNSKDWPVCGTRDGICACGEKHYGKLLAELMPGYRPDDLKGRDKTPWLPEDQ